MATTIPTSYLAGLKLVTSESNGSALSASFANSTQYLCIPMSSLPELTAVEANPSSGDIRKIMFAFETAIYNAYNAIAVDNRPTRWTNSRSQSFSSDGLTITRNFNHQIVTGVSGEEVVNEPA